MKVQEEPLRSQMFAKVLPQKEHYRRAKVITTGNLILSPSNNTLNGFKHLDDFSDIRKQNRRSEDRCSSEDQAKSSEESTQLNRT